jgi:hypothetical protein
MTLSSSSKKSTLSDSESDSDDEVHDELPFLRQENERLGLLLDNRDDMLREAKKKRKELRATLKDARTSVAELETQNFDAKLEIDLHEKIDEMHSCTISREARLKERVPTSCSTCELHALKNLELSHYVDRLQDENDELRKLMGWLSSHEPQLRIMIETFKRQDGEGLGANKVGERSGENITEPSKTDHKNDFPPKPNHLRKRLNTTQLHPCFLQKQMISKILTSL